MGYGKYWNFERVLAKVQVRVSQKEYSLAEHFVEIEEMAELGSGATRKVISLNLSRVACMAVTMNADAKKAIVKVARNYYSQTMMPEIMEKSMESTIILYRGAKGKAQVQVIFDTDTFWLSQQRMAESFGVTVPTINYHLDQIDKSGEIHFMQWTGYFYAPYISMPISVSWKVKTL